MKKINVEVLSQAPITDMKSENVSTVKELFIWLFNNVNSKDIIFNKKTLETMNKIEKCLQENKEEIDDTYYDFLVNFLDTIGVKPRSQALQMYAALNITFDCK